MSRLVKLAAIACLAFGVMAAIALAKAPLKTGSWTGSSAAGGRVQLTVSPNGQRVTSFSVRSCGFLAKIDNPAPIANRKFTGTATVSGFEYFRVTGTFNQPGTGVSGSFKQTACGTVGWSAKPAAK